MIVLGDLNTFEFTDDLTEILPAGGVLENLVNTLTDDGVYPFNFEGNFQVLDHMLMAPRLAAAAELDIVHVNVDFPRLDDPIGSDHEPLVARIALRAIGNNE